MSEAERLIFKDGGEEFEVYIETREQAHVPEGEPGYRDSFPTVNLQEVHKTIRGYARYAIGAFVNFGLAEVEEMNLEFNLKISGKAGLPILASTSTEGSFKIQVKCKFPGKSSDG